MGGGFLFPQLSLRSVSEPLLADAQEGQRGGGGRSWVGALLWSAPAPPALALWRWAGLCCGLFAPTLASTRPPRLLEGNGDRRPSGGAVSGLSREEVGVLGLCTSQGGGTLGVHLAPSRLGWLQ